MENLQSTEQLLEEKKSSNAWIGWAFFAAAFIAIVILSFNVSSKNDKIEEIGMEKDYTDSIAKQTSMELAGVKEQLKNTEDSRDYWYASSESLGNKVDSLLLVVKEKDSLFLLSTKKPVVTSKKSEKSSGGKIKKVKL